MKFRNFFLLSVVVLAAGAAAIYTLITRPYAGFSKPVLIDLPRGLSTRAMADRLAAQGVIPTPLSFLAIRLLRPNDRLQAGEYEFRSAASPQQVFERIHQGDVFHYEFTVPEGSHRWDIARIASSLGFISESDFLKAAADPSLIADIAPQATSLEGYLFPSTYRVTRQTTARQLCKIMSDEFRAEWKRLTPPAGVVHQIVTLASLVEKETGVPAERATVASVYTNRLAQGIKLECDPTVIYAALLENRYRGTIYKSDLENPHPYNTYRHPGLPPGPIASPGRAALDAALHPAETPFIFFVAKPDGSGGHEFTTNLSAHNKAVAEYRRGLKENSTHGMAGPAPAPRN
jgi:UPF0755 protein